MYSTVYSVLSECICNMYRYTHIPCVQHSLKRVQYCILSAFRVSLYMYRYTHIPCVQHSLKRVQYWVFFVFNFMLIHADIGLSSISID